MTLSIWRGVVHEGRMILSAVFERFVQLSPITVMTRALMESVLSPDEVNRLFEESASEQYTRKLMFSTIVDLMGVVVSKSQPSLHSAIQAVKTLVPASVACVYEKVNGVEPEVVRELVRHSSDKLSRLVVTMKGQMPALLPGYRVMILDGNHLAATERRLEVLKRSKAGPLPGHALVVLEPELMLVRDMIPCEDGHAQERSLTPQILDLVCKGDVWIDDRNFCTTPLLGGIALRKAFFISRQHAALPCTPVGPLKKCGKVETGTVFEQPVEIALAGGEVLKARRIVIRLNVPTRDGDDEMAILTNLPQEAAIATKIANLYRKRWTIETMFQSLTQMLRGEIDTLGYPRAALLGFGIALVTYNILSTAQAALRAKFGAERIQEEVSGYYIAHEVQSVSRGMNIAVEPDNWTAFHKMPHKTLCSLLVKWAGHVDLRKYKRHPRGPKTPGANPAWTLRGYFDFGGVGPFEYRRQSTEAFRQDRCTK
jgi:Transposase DDE domain